MVDSVSNYGSSYLDHVKGKNPPATTPAPKLEAKPADKVSLSQNVVNLLQATGAGSQAGGALNNLLGGKNSLPGVYDSLAKDKTVSQPLQQAIQSAQAAAAQAKTKNDSVQNNLKDYHKASNAYNKASLQHAKDVLKANHGQLT